ncbi:TetR family transcriptional regulator [Stella sp.]|uniref:TetR family transcriptional regulator n=1 Tax=Stella sp. TaxID=2912054 RepID=UPI0035ADEC83
MRVTREQAAENRRRIVEAAARLFRERGFSGVGVAEIMAAAGLTHGGFYGHFRSKEDLARVACRAAIDQATEGWRQRAAGHPEAPLAALADAYLTPRHRDAAGRGCIHAALTAEVARIDDPELRHAFTEGLAGLAEVLAEAGPEDAAEARAAAALVRLSTMVGALVLARAVDDRALSDRILAAARAAVAA